MKNALSRVLLLLVAAAVVFVACGDAGRGPADLAEGPDASIGSSAQPAPSSSGPEYRLATDVAGVVRGHNDVHQLDVQLAGAALGLSHAGGHAWQLGLTWTGLGRGATIAGVAGPS